MAASVFYFKGLEDKLSEKDESEESQVSMEELVAQQAEKKEEYLRKIRAEEEARLQAEEDARLAREAARKAAQEAVASKNAEPTLTPKKPPNSFYDANLQRRLMGLPPLPRRTVIEGKPIPFEVAIPPHWKMLSWQDPVVAVANERSLVRLEIGPWATSMEEYVALTIEELTGSFPEMEKVGEEQVTLDGKKWTHVVFRGPILDYEGEHEMSLLIYGSRRGSYRFVVEGSRHNLEQDARDITLMLTSFRFPPDNFEPPDAKEVRVYVDGERVNF